MNSINPLGSSSLIPKAAHGVCRLRVCSTCSALTWNCQHIKIWEMLVMIMSGFLGNRISGNWVIPAELWETQLQPWALFLYSSWTSLTLTETDRWTSQCLQAHFSLYSEIYLNPVFARKEGSFYQKYSRVRITTDKMKYPWPRSVIFVYRDFLNGHVKIKSNRHNFIGVIKSFGIINVGWDVKSNY